MCSRHVLSSRMNKKLTSHRLFNRARFRTILLYVIVSLLFVAAIAIVDDDLVRHIAAIETWLGRLGPWGLVAFAVLFVIATSILIPETALSIMAGALFGLTWGLVAAVAGTLLAASLQYALSRWLLRSSIERTLESRRQTHEVRPEGVTSVARNQSCRTRQFSSATCCRFDQARRPILPCRSGGGRS